MSRHTAICADSCSPNVFSLVGAGVRRDETAERGFQSRAINLCGKWRKLFFMRICNYENFLNTARGHILLNLLAFVRLFSQSLDPRSLLPRHQRRTGLEFVGVDEVKNRCTFTTLIVVHKSVAKVTGAEVSTLVVSTSVLTASITCLTFIDI